MSEEDAGCDPVVNRRNKPRTLTAQNQADYEETVKDAAEKRAVGFPNISKMGFWFVKHCFECQRLYSS